MISKLDYFIAGLIGFFAGIFAIPTLLNLGFREGALLLALPWALGILVAFGVWLGGVLSRWVSFLSQFSRFAAAGILSTVIDFGILNLVSALTGITAGIVVGWINIPGFSVAVVNAYLWNKLWVFKRPYKGSVFADFLKFLPVSIVGLFLNSGIIILIIRFVGPYFTINDKIILNLAKVLATGVALVWNFTGYKFLVFRQKTAIGT